MTDRTPAEIAASLTKAQREYLTVKAQWRQPRAGAEALWMTFPPPNTHAVLQRLGLVDRHGIITPLGLEVRAELMKEHNNA